MTQRISGKFAQNFGDLKTEDLLPVTVDSLAKDLKFAHEHNLQLEVAVRSTLDLVHGHIELLVGDPIMWQDVVKAISAAYPGLEPCMRWKPYGDTDTVTFWLRRVGEKDFTDRRL